MPKGQIPWNKGLKGVQVAWNKGIPRTDEEKKNISVGCKRNYKKENHPNYGKPRSEELKEKQRKSMLGRKHTDEHNKKIGASSKGKFSGDKHWNWKGGISVLITNIKNCDKYSEWRTQIFGRDNFTCQHCGNRGSWLNAHHIKKFSLILEEHNITSVEEALNCESLWNIDNGITYCKNCHKLLNKNGGIINDFK